MPEYHQPVLVNEVLTLLDPREGGVFLDASLGGGGHAEEVLKRIGPSGRLIGIDRDSEAIEFARMRLGAMDGQKTLVEGNFGELESILSDIGVSELDGALFDFGVSSHQLDSPRGFSFQREEALDMRMGKDARSAADIVNQYTERELEEIIRDYGEERYAKRVAKAIVRRRAYKPILTTVDLVEAVVSAIPGGGRGQDIHPATRTFQAIRIEANGELDAIERALPVAINALKIGAVIVVISFHSLEDRIAKTIFRKFSGKCECPPRIPQCQCGAAEILKILTRKPVVPSAEEIASNPRSRSSKLRAAVKIA